MPDVWAALVAALVVGPVPHGPPALGTALAFVVTVGTLGVLAALTHGLESFGTMLRVRLPRSHRVVFAVAVLPVLAAWALQPLLTLALLAGTVPPALVLGDGILPVGIALTALTGWWSSFPTARSRRRPPPIPRVPAAPSGRRWTAPRT